MRIAPIVNQLAAYLPFFTDKFTDTLDIISASQSEGIATIETSTPHGLVVGSTFVATGIVPLIPVNNLTLINTDQVIVRTLLDNGLVSTYDFKTNKPKNVAPPNLYIQDVIEPAYNGEFPIVDVPNRFAAIYQLPTAPVLPPKASGNLLRYAANGYVGLKTVTNVIDTTTFEYAIDSNQPETTTNTGLIHTKARISGVVDLTRAEDSYTRQGSDQYWLFVTQNDSFASKDRNTLNDGLTTIKSTVEYRQRLIDSINVFVFVPTSEQLSARAAIDALEDIKIALFKTLVRFKAPIEYDAQSSFQLFFDSVNTVGYTTAYVVQQFIFQGDYDITYYDTFDSGLYSPFRDITASSLINGENYLWSSNLDVDPDF